MASLILTAIEGIIVDQFHEVKENYPGLNLSSVDDGWLIEGSFHFVARYEEQEIEDTYELSIHVPFAYPEVMPVVKETGGRIPKDFHTNYNGSLCLEIPSRQQRMFQKSPTLLGFIQGPVISFLFSHHMFENTGDLPFGEWKHGAEGLLDAYALDLGLNDPLVIVAFLKLLADRSYSRQLLCPCGSGLKLRKCHKTQLLTMMNTSSEIDTLYEAYSIILYVKNTLGMPVPSRLLPARLITNELLYEWQKRGKL